MKRDSRDVTREERSIFAETGGAQCDRNAACTSHGAIKSLTAPVMASAVFLLVQMTFGCRGEHFKTPDMTAEDGFSE